MSLSLRSRCWSSAQCSSLYQPVFLVMDVWILSTSGLSQTVLIRMCLSLFGALVLTFLWRICLERSGRVAGEAQAQLPHIRSRSLPRLRGIVLRPKSYRVSPRLQACSPPSTAGSWGSCNLRPGSLLCLCPVVPASHSCSGPRPAQAIPRPVQTACSSRSRPLTCAPLFPVSPPRLGCSESHVAPRCPRPVSLASPVRLITVFFCWGEVWPAWAASVLLPLAEKDQRSQERSLSQDGNSGREKFLNSKIVEGTVLATQCQAGLNSEGSAPSGHCGQWGPPTPAASVPWSRWTAGPRGPGCGGAFKTRGELHSRRSEASR